MGINLETSHSEDSKGYAITNCANRCSSKKGKHKILFNRMLAWPNGNCDFKNCVNILWHLQVVNMIIFYLFLAPEWRGYRHVLKGYQLRPKLCPHAQSFCFDHAKIRAQLINGNLGMVSAHVPEALQMSFYSISLHHALAYPNIFVQSIRISNKIISTSELWWVWGRGRGAA